VERLRLTTLRMQCKGSCLLRRYFFPLAWFLERMERLWTIVGSFRSLKRRWIMRNIRHKYMISESSIFFIRRCLRHNVFYKAVFYFFPRKKWKSKKWWQTICRFHKIYLCTLNLAWLFECSTTSSAQGESNNNLFCMQELHSSKHCTLLVQSQYELIMELEITVFDDTNSELSPT
jgi:hypothetical protein